jgi:hypothetical protein
MATDNHVDLDETPDEDLIEFLLDRNANKVSRKEIKTELARLRKLHPDDIEKQLGELMPRIDAATKSILDKIELEAKPLGLALACAAELSELAGGDEEDDATDESDESEPEDPSDE